MANCTENEQKRERKKCENNASRITTISTENKRPKKQKKNKKKNSFWEHGKIHFATA